MRFGEISLLESGNILFGYFHISIVHRLSHIMMKAIQSALLLNELLGCGLCLDISIPKQLYFAHCFVVCVSVYPSQLTSLPSINPTSRNIDVLSFNLKPTTQSLA